MTVQPRILWSQLRIGATVSLLVFVTVISVFFIDQVRDAVAERYTLYFYTLTTQTLRPRAPVWFAGQPVGQVSHLRFEPPTRDAAERLRVELSLRADVQHLIREGAVARIITSGVVGEAVVNILPISETALALPDQGQLSVAAGVDPGEVTRRLRALTDSLKPVAERWKAVVGLLRDGSGTLPQVMRKPAEVEELQSNLSQLAATFDALAGTAGLFAEVVTEEETKAALNRIGPRLSQLASRWNRREGTIGRLASERVFMERLESIAQRISRLSERLETGRGTLGRLLNDPALVTELKRTRDSIQELLASFATLADSRSQPGS